MAITLILRAGNKWCSLPLGGGLKLLRLYPQASSGNMHSTDVLSIIFWSKRPSLLSLYFTSGLTGNLSNDLSFLISQCRSHLCVCFELSRSMDTKLVSQRERNWPAIFFKKTESSILAFGFHLKQIFTMELHLSSPTTCDLAFMSEETRSTGYLWSRFFITKFWRFIMSESLRQPILWPDRLYI